MPRYPDTLAELFPQFAWYGDRLNPPLFAALVLYDGKLYALGTRYRENARDLQQKFAALYAGGGLVALDPRDVREWQNRNEAGLGFVCDDGLGGLDHRQRVPYRPRL